jgi:cardiolipin synthase A/B
VTGSLHDAIADIALRLPPAQVDSVAATVAVASGPDDVHAPGAPNPAVRTCVDRIIECWRSEPDTTGGGLALALRTAARTAERQRAVERLEVVWTGPTTHGVPVRLTKQVLLEVIGDARTHLLLLSFAAYRVQAVIDALAAAGTRGVTTDLVLETVEDSAGRLSHDAAASLDAVHAVRVWHWPASERPGLDAGRAALHAKAAVADSGLAFVTSANLTGHALEENIEPGLLERV